MSVDNSLFILLSIVPQGVKHHDGTGVNIEFMIWQGLVRDNSQHARRSSKTRGTDSNRSDQRPCGGLFLLCL
jgi:hypothetical protein